MEQEILGTAGGMKRMERLFTEPFVIVYGDVLTDMDLGQFIRFHRSLGDQPHATLSVYRAATRRNAGLSRSTRNIA